MSQNFILVNLMTSLVLDMYAYRMQRTESDKMVQLKYEMSDGSTQIWTVLKNLDWKLQVAENSLALQKLADLDLEESIQNMEVTLVLYNVNVTSTLGYTFPTRLHHAVLKYVKINNNGSYRQ